MKRRKEILKNQTPWMTSFTSSLSGTILGIMLTFGISAYMQQQESREFFEKTIEFSLSNIERHIDDIEALTKETAHRDSLFQYLYRYYPLDADKANSDTINMCIDEFQTYSFLGMDNSAQTIFSNNIETWKNSSNLQLIEEIGDCFAAISLSNHEQEHLNKLKEDLVFEYLNRVESDRDLNPNQRAKVFFKTPGFRNYISQHNLYSRVVKAIAHDLRRNYNYADSVFCVELGIEPGSRL